MTRKHNQSEKSELTNGSDYFGGLAREVEMTFTWEKWEEYYRKAIRDHHKEGEWACIFELRVGTGYETWAEKRIDAFVINCYPSTGNHKIVYEIKRTRSDFLNELKKPFKRHPALMFSNQFYFLTPVDLIQVKELPQEAGLIEIDEQGKWLEKAKAPHREAYPPVWPMVASIARRLDRRDREKLI